MEDILEQADTTPRIDATTQAEITAQISKRVNAAQEAIAALIDYLNDQPVEIPEEDSKIIDDTLEDLARLRSVDLVTESKYCAHSVERLFEIIKKLGDGKYRLYSKKKNKKTGKRRNLGTFSSRKKAQEREREVQYFKHAGK